MVLVSSTPVLPEYSYPHLLDNMCVFYLHVRSLISFSLTHLITVAGFFAVFQFIPAIRRVSRLFILSNVL